MTIEALRVNPFAPSVTVRGFVMQERSGAATFVTFDELYINAGWSSIFRLAPVVNEARLVKPSVHVIRESDGTYNFQDLVDGFMARPKNDEPPPKFAAFNLQLVDGRIDVDDRAKGEKHGVTDLRIGIPFISSLPSHVDVTVAPELSARINGAPVGVKGETLPFQDTHVTTLNVELEKFDLTRLADYLPFELRGKVKSALLDTRLVVAFEQRGDAPRITVRGSASVNQFNIHDPEDRPLVACQRIAVEINEVDVLAPAVDLKSVVIEQPDVHIRRDKSGVINLERVGIVAAEGDQKQRAARTKTGKAAVPVKFGSFVVASGRVGFSDERTAPTFEAAVEDLSIEARDFDNTVKDKRNEIAIHARTQAGESFKLDVATTADPRSAEGRLDVVGLRLKKFQPYVSQVSNLEVEDGRFAIGFAFRWASDLAYEKHELTVSDLALALQGFRAHLGGEKQPLFRVASIEVKGAGARLKERTANLGSIRVREAAIHLRREKDGKLNLGRIVRDGAVDTAPPAVNSVATPAATPATPWRIDLGALSLDRSSVALEDLAVRDPGQARHRAARAEGTEPFDRAREARPGRPARHDREAWDVRCGWSAFARSAQRKLPDRSAHDRLCARAAVHRRPSKPCRYVGRGLGERHGGVRACNRRRDEGVVQGRRQRHRFRVRGQADQSGSGEVAVAFRRCGRLQPAAAQGRIGRHRAHRLLRPHRSFGRCTAQPSGPHVDTRHHPGQQTARWQAGRSCA